MDPSYWARHLREPVQFSPGVAELLNDPAIVLLEVGPGQTLGTLAGQQPDNASDRVALASLRPPKGEQSEVEFLLKTVGRLWRWVWRSTGPAFMPVSSAGVYRYRRIRLSGIVTGSIHRQPR